MKRFAPYCLILVSLAALDLCGHRGAISDAAAQPGNVDYWLGRATTAPARQPATQPAIPSAPTSQAPSRPDAIPGAVQIGSGRLDAGGIYTTQGKDLQVWVESQKRWRHVPMVIIRAIHAVVVSEQLDSEWRWKQTGSDEKVYTGRRRPVRRLQWRVNLVDGTSLTGEIKGQPLWIERNGRRVLHVLGARTKGEWGQTLSDLDYPAHIVLSRREMERVIKHLGSAR